MRLYDSPEIFERPPERVATVYQSSFPLLSKKWLIYATHHPNSLYTKFEVRFGTQRGEMSGGHFPGSNLVASTLHVQGFRETETLIFFRNLVFL